MNFGDLLTKLGGYVGAIVTILSFMTILIKPMRERFTDWIGKVSNRDDINTKIDALTALVEKSIEQNDKLQEETKKQSEALRASLRNSILNLYYKCLAKGSITTFELQNLSELYENYKALGGNSFIHNCVERLKRLEVRDDLERNNL